MRKKAPVLCQGKPTRREPLSWRVSQPTAAWCIGEFSSTA
jgi:hypothetical protein